MSTSKRKISTESTESRKKKPTKDGPWRGELGPCIEIPERVERVFYHEYVESPKSFKKNVSGLSALDLIEPNVRDCQILPRLPILFCFFGWNISDLLIETNFHQGSAKFVNLAQSITKLVSAINSLISETNIPKQACTSFSCHEM